mmetsp:Transcript_158945/g.509903  ORF Transcript_158945/g.509903 Transcript_158945/m.509903 type:complete len:374 (+) Transcript_158945:127-1248(+)
MLRPVHESLHDHGTCLSTRSCLQQKGTLNPSGAAQVFAERDLLILDSALATLRFAARIHKGEQVCEHLRHAGRLRRVRCAMPARALLDRRHGVTHRHSYLYTLQHLDIVFGVAECYGFRQRAAKLLQRSLKAICLAAERVKQGQASRQRPHELHAAASQGLETLATGVQVLAAADEVEQMRLPAARRLLRRLRPSRSATERRNGSSITTQARWLRVVVVLVQMERPPLFQVGYEVSIAVAEHDRELARVCLRIAQHVHDDVHGDGALVDDGPTLAIDGRAVQKNARPGREVDSITESRLSRSSVAASAKQEVQAQLFNLPHGFEVGRRRLVVWTQKSAVHVGGNCPDPGEVRNGIRLPPAQCARRQLGRVHRE